MIVARARRRGGAAGGWCAAALLLALPTCGGGPARRPVRAVLLVTIDTLRADHLGVYGYERPTSPRLDAFARTATVFDHAYGASSWTLPSLTTMQTGLPPQAHLCVANDSVLDAAHETLAERLRAAGVRTAAVANHVFMHRRHGLDQGFEDYMDELVAETFRTSHEAVTSPRVTELAGEWIERVEHEAPGSKWFLWAHYFDPHEVYHRHEGFDFGDEDMDRYDSEIAFTDHYVGRLLDRLEAIGVAEEVAVLVCADHGEAFGDHGSVHHRQDLFVETARVPFLLRVPGGVPGRVRTPVSVADVAPTILDLLGVAAPRNGFSASLVPACRGEALVDHPPPLLELTSPFQAGWEALVAGDLDLLLDRDRDRLLLFDHERDPRQLHDLAAERPADARRLVRWLDRLASRARGLAVSGAGRTRLGDEELDALRQLGYVEGAR